jgi:hypothetical protein
MITIFSSLDGRARPKGSRDALGAEAVWSHLGRKIVGNLTTVTSNLDNFVVALLCCHYANHVANRNDDTRLIQERYLRAEQVSAYLKLLAGNLKSGFFGITRAAENFAGDRILLGAAPRAQLLASQASYGLWGLYSSALEGAALIAGANRRLTPSGSTLVDAILSRLGTSRWDAFCTLAGATWFDKTAGSVLAPHFTRMLSDAALRGAVVHALLAKQRDCLLQAELFALAQAFLGLDQEIGPARFSSWIEKNADASDVLKGTMRRIASLDPLLAFAERMMSWLQTRHDIQLDELAATLQPYLNGLVFGDAWQSEHELPHRAFLQNLQTAASTGDAASTIRTVVEQNRSLMRARGGGAWIDTDGGRLKVRVRNDRPADLYALQSPGTTWRYSYFLHSFLTIAQQGRA